MKIRLVFVVFFISFIDHFICAIKYQNIGDCYYDNGSYAESNLTLICEENIRETTLFKQYDKSVCQNQIECFNSDCSEGFYKFMIGTIRFEDCELSQIPSNIFKVYENVRVFNMANLGTQTFTSDFFSDAKRLSNLNASYNQISEIPSNSFVNCEKLTDVDVSFNKITHFDAHAFAVGNHLQSLNLSHNNITELSVETFQKLTELKQLNLAYNQIAELPSFLFHKNEKLTDVNMSHNKIHKIDDFAFAGDFKLKKLNLSHNKLTTFQKRFSDNHSNLTHLDVSNNRIAAIKVDTFESLRDLAFLDLSENLLKILDNKTFENQRNLRQLNLSRNHLTEITAGTFASLITLEILDLSNNALKILNAIILPIQANQLELILIANNKLHELIDFTSARIPNTKIIGIDSNPFNCTYLDALFQSITWKHLDSISKRIACNSATENNEPIDLSENVTFTWALETTTTSDLVTIPVVETATEKPDERIMANEQNGNNIKIANLWKSQMKNERAMKSLRKYFYIFMCIVTVGFTVIAYCFMRMFVEMRYMSRAILKPEYDVKYTIEPPNGVDNHAYETIEIRKSTESVKTPICNFFEIYFNVFELDMSNLGVETLKPESFESGTELFKLNASHNKITEIPFYLLKETVNLTILDLSNNQISRFDPNAFSLGNSLKYLVLESNNISELSAEMFYKLTELEYVYVSYNQITKIPANLLDSFVLLKKMFWFAFFILAILAKDIHSHELDYGEKFHDNSLNWGNKNINELSPNMFKVCCNDIKKLILSYNKIEQVPSFVFQTLKQLTDINLSNNEIQVIDDFAFAGDLNLKKLDLSVNKIMYFTEYFVRDHTRLVHLNIAFNQISFVAPDTFDTLGELLVLDLSNNLIDEFDSKTFVNLVKLEHLKLSHNKLEDIETEAFSFLINLQTLDLSYNKLKTLDIKTLPKPLYRMKSLLLAENQLKELIGLTSATMGRSLKIKGIDRNKFNCTYLHQFFKSITWNHLDTISTRIECNYFVYKNNNINDAVQKFDQLFTLGIITSVTCIVFYVLTILMIELVMEQHNLKKNSKTSMKNEKTLGGNNETSMEHEETMDESSKTLKTVLNDLRAKYSSFSTNEKPVEQSTQKDFVDIFVDNIKNSIDGIRNK
ncbi:chaoptin-like [Contarinia nasturtii]|uniref:chaoptin-like n=1 Tax=Contarinia nasturtii TaxID=265458 RepID=UPI0012D468D5|nr:chaoptin-like [Contarinia nasturtii]